MRYIKLVLFTCVIMLTSCSDFLDKEPDDMLNLEKVFSNEQNVNRWLAHLYSKVPSVVDNYMQDGPLSDDMAPHAEWTGWFASGVVDKQMGNWNPTSVDYHKYWVELPKLIRQAQVFIRNVKPLEKQNLSVEEVERMKLEARFLIAYYYALLVEYYGAVPFNLEPLGLDASQEVLMQQQTPVHDIISWVDQELHTLSSLLPANYVNSSLYGRATSLTCLAVRSRLLLFAASPLLNGNSDYQSHTNKNGEELLYSPYSVDRWKAAADAANELIEAAHAAGKKLHVVYNGDGSIDPFLSLRGVLMKRESEGNLEILFPSPRLGGWGGDIDTWATPRGAQGAGAYGVTQSLVDAFFMENGLPPILGYENNDYSKPIINTASGYSETGFSVQPEVRNTNWIETQGDVYPGQVTLAGTYNMYCQREARFYIAVLYNRAWYRNGLDGGRTTQFMRGEIDGGISMDAPRNGYLQNKLAHPDRDPKTYTYPYRPSIISRLAEAYLNYAEALNEYDPGHPDILKYINLIRERAGIPQYGNQPGMIAISLSQENVREAIHRERRVELAGESGIRYMDIRRLKLGEKLLNRDYYGMNYFGTKLSDDPNDPESYFVRTRYQTRSFQKKNYFYPVPQVEIDINPNLVQNPLWDN